MTEILLPHEAQFSDEDFDFIKQACEAYKKRAEDIIFKIDHLRREEGNNEHTLG